MQPQQLRKIQATANYTEGLITNQGLSLANELILIGSFYGGEPLASVVVPESGNLFTSHAQVFTIFWALVFI